MSELKIFTIYPNERYPDFQLDEGELFAEGEPCLAMTEEDKAEFDAAVDAYDKWQKRIRWAADKWHESGTAALLSTGKAKP